MRKLACVVCVMMAVVVSHLVVEGQRCWSDVRQVTVIISPRLVDVSSRSTSNYVMRDTYWVTKNSN